MSYADYANELSKTAWEWLVYLKEVSSDVVVAWWRHTPDTPVPLDGKDDGYVIIGDRGFGKTTGKNRNPKVTPKIHIPKPLRDQTWVYYIGNVFSDKCPCCSHATIDALHFECGHVHAEAMGGATCLKNLRPVCRTCNGSMGKKHMFDFMERCGFSPERMEDMNRKANLLG